MRTHIVVLLSFVALILSGSAYSQNIQANYPAELHRDEAPNVVPEAEALLLEPGVDSLSLAALPMPMPGPAVPMPHAHSETLQPVVPKKQIPAPAVSPVPASKVSTWIIDRVPTKQKDGTEIKCVSFTFDDGPDPKYTPQILALLKKHRVPAVFCVVGRQVKRYPELVAQIVADGHKIANHSMNHDECLPSRSDAKVQQEVLTENALIAEAAPGTLVEYFRAPGGVWSLHLRRLVAAWGMKSLGWSIDTKDWQQPGTESIVKHVNENIKPGALILMHDGGGDRSQSVAALKKLLPKLEKDGYSFVLPQ